MKKWAILVAVLTLSLVAVPASSKAANVRWDLTGTYTIVFSCTSGCSGDWPHTMNIESMNLVSGDFSGTGHYNSIPAYTWDVTGSVSGSSIEFEVAYTGLNPGYTVNATGTINRDGSLSGDATGPGQIFTWASTSGKASRFAGGGGPNGIHVRFIAGGHTYDTFWLMTGSGLVHEWRYDDPAGPWKGMDVHLVFKPKDKFETAECDSEGLLTSFSWTFDYGYYTELGGDKADLVDFLEDGSQYWVCVYNWID